MENLIQIAIMPLEDAKTLKRQLEAKNLKIELNHKDSTCKSGCGVNVEVYAKEADIPSIAKMVEDNFKNMVESNSFDFKNLNQVFDPNQNIVICPACSHEFQPTSNECPDCGLFFG